MKVLVKGAGFYGAHVALALLKAGIDVEVHDTGPHAFCGASGKIPARLHLGAPHYCRSAATRRACIEHQPEFLEQYGFLTRAIPLNLYAVASDHSTVDFGTYVKIMQGEIEFLTVYDPAEFGLQNIEGAIQCAERHILTDKARAYFEAELAGRLFFLSDMSDDARGFDYVVDCTFAANSAVNIDRYEPCMVLLLEGRADRAITVVDGPFPSLYAWDEARSLCSLSSARWTPFSKDCKTYAHARAVLDSLSKTEIEHQGEQMIESMAHFYPAVRDYRVADYMLSIRAMPLSGADTRLVDVRRDGEKLIRIRAGKIDAVIAAEKAVKEIIDVA